MRFRGRPFRYADMIEDFYRRSVLLNGLRVLTAPMPHTRSVAISVYVGAGSRYENDQEAGVSHFLEHMLFKGTEKRPTAREIAEAIDGVGGMLNGGTDREFTVYYIKVARPHLDLALDILSDLVRRPLIAPEEFEKERQVVLEELAAISDAPAQLADLLLDSLVWPGHPLGRDVGGTPESVSALTRDMVMGYMHRQYSPNNVVVALAGDVDHEMVTSRIEGELGGWEPNSPGGWLPANIGLDTRFALRFKSTEQAHICLALPGLPLDHPDRHALSFLSIILGEGMSSRLFLELREKRGLVYDVHSYVAHFLDTGTLNVYMAVDPKNAPAALELTLSEISRLKDEGPSEEELTKARELSRGRLLLRMEDTRNVSGWIGAQEILLGRVRSVEQAMADMEAVKLDDLRRLAGWVLPLAHAQLAVVGPFRSDKRFARLLGA